MIYCEGKMAGDCGTCTMCCKLMAVKELKKPKNVACTHCEGGVGCKIYEDRPGNCRAFRCLWLQSQSLEENAMSLEARPDKSKVVLHTTPDERSVVAHVDPNYPDAWRWKEIGLLLGCLSEKILVLVDEGKRYWVLEKFKAREIRMSEPDEDGVEHFLEYVE